MLELSTPTRVPSSSATVRGAEPRLDDWIHLDRFLAGCDGGTYHATTAWNAPTATDAIQRCLAADGLRFVSRIVATCESGRAPKNDPAIFSLALAAKSGDEPARRAAYAALPRVCRLATDLMRFADHAQRYGGWGRGMRRAVGAWFNARPADELAHHLALHHSGERWSVRDLLRLAHPRAASPAHDRLFAWAVKGVLDREAIDDPACAPIVALHELARATDDGRGVATAAATIREHAVPRDRVPEHLLRFPEIWDALLDTMSATELLASLPAMTRTGFVVSRGAAVGRVTRQLHSIARMTHPFAFASALVGYRTGRGRRSSWLPVLEVIEALEAAFRASLERTEPSGSRMLVSLDISRSMSTGSIGGVPGLTPQLASTAMAMTATADGARVAAFTSTSDLTPISIGDRDRLDEVVAATAMLPMAGTDCALPMTWARRNRLDVDTFVVFTDDETRAGDVHPVRALRAYREARGIPAKLVVVGMMSTGFRIADPDDAGMLDVVGFDASVPPVLSDFARA